MASISADEEVVCLSTLSPLANKGLLQVNTVISKTPIVDTFQTYQGEMGIFEVRLYIRKMSGLRRLFRLGWGKWKPVELKEPLYLVLQEDSAKTPLDFGYIETPELGVLELNAAGLWTKDQVKELVSYHKLINQSLSSKLSE